MQKIAQFILKLMGWKIIGSLPNIKQYVLIVAPHTSNWDLVIGLCARFAVGVKINFLAKHQLFFFPLGNLLGAIGGTPVDRTKHGNRVEQAVALFQQQESFKLGLAPEGTRSPVTRWKEGFYHMACQANIPIVMVGFDYTSKEVRVREPFLPTKDISNDFATILSFFRTIRGKYPKELPDYQTKE
jgi:1-acyl-sn-glycerol-3-phosphate acyltransferase